jgi:hypothetical protein
MDVFVRLVTATSSPHDNVLNSVFLDVSAQTSARSTLMTCASAIPQSLPLQIAQVMQIQL